MKRTAPFKQSLVILTGLLLTACSAQNQAQKSPDRWIKQMHNRAPTASTIYVCHTFGCKLNFAFHPTRQDMNRLKSILAKGAKNPKAERQAIGNAIAWLEKRVGPKIGSDNDKGGLDMQHSGISGQMDCIDEASNTTSYLSFVQLHGLLKYHKVQSPVARGFFLDLRYPHATAVILDTTTGNRFAVDSWIYDNGVFPAIKPLDVWMAEQPAR